MTTVVRPNPNAQMVKPEPPATLETQVADAEWRHDLIDESRTYEIWRTLGRTDATDYLGETVAAHPFAELRAALATPTEEVQP